MKGSDDTGVANHLCSEFRGGIGEETPEELVSVIIPAFDAAANIRQTLNSVLAQTYQSFEALVVDDGSSDGTSAIVEEFVRKDSRFQIIRQSNNGVGGARNAGIRKARGKYIAPLDADDLWFPEKLEKQVACMARCGNETGLVYCWSTAIDEHGEVLNLCDCYTVEGRLRYVLVLNHIFCNASVPLFRAVALEKVGLYLTRAEQGGAQGCEDWDLALRIAEIFSVRVVPECLVAYRQTRSSISVDFGSMAASYAVMMCRARQRNCDLPSVAFRWSAGYFYWYLVNKCYVWGYYSRCLHYLKEAACANPFLLLKTDVYRKFINSVLRILTGQTADSLAKQVQPSPEKKEKEAELRSKRERKGQFISNRIFRRIELSRWSTALRD